jgi:hypothetical protein
MMGMNIEKENVPYIEDFPEILASFVCGECRVETEVLMLLF